ncbi:MAG: M18 family aminopeptidase [Clostridia bacterium]|nr:M18 family aminopeptidase [Clostridia bacterium]
MTIEKFLQSSYTAYHTVANCKAMLDSNGFSQLFFGSKWQLTKGGKYYVTKNDSTIVAFVVGDLTSYAFNIAESHTDSPCLKAKGNTLCDSPEGKRINVEKYGGGLWYSFLDTPLKVAGRLFVKQGDKVACQLVDSSYTVAIPSLCVHHNPASAENLQLNVQTDLLPLLGNANDLWSTLTTSEVVDADLYVVPAVEASYTGANGEFLTSPRIDNLTSVYTSIKALCSCKPTGVAMAACFDNEEVGSHTKQGACSAFLPQLLQKINRELGFDQDDYDRAVAGGFALSIDNGHAVHPAHPEKSDVINKVYLNGGVVIKHHVNYATDGLSSAVVKALLNANGIAWQDYYNRSDLRCGSTLGLVTSSQLQMNACDVGLAQLAMHSAVETVGARDVDTMQKAVTAFFDCTIQSLVG